MSASQSDVRLPDLIIVDGGKGQLSAACRELQRLGLHELPIIGLAKELEEIYSTRPRISVATSDGFPRPAFASTDPRRSTSIRQCVSSITDEEAGRRKILDDCPGVSQNRKSLLLVRFGSVNRPSQSERGGDRCDGRHRAETGGGSSSLFAAPLTNPP